MDHRHPSRTSRYTTPRVNRTGPAPRPRHNPDVKPEKVLQRNLLRAAVMLVLMGIATLISIKALRYQWSRIDRRMNPPRAASEPAAEPFLPAPELAVPPGDDLPPPAPITDATNKLQFLIRRAEMLAEEGDAGEAIQRYREALVIDPENAAVLAALGRLQLLSGQYPDAAATLERAAQSAASPDLINDYGTALLQNGQAEAALEQFDTLIRDYPAYAKGYFNAGIANRYLGRDAEAYDRFAAYRDLAPTDARPLREMAMILWNRGEQTDALATLNAAIGVQADWDMLYLDAALMSARMGEVETALDYLRRAQPHADPAAIYQIYQRTMFRDVRRTEAGIAFEQELARRAREQLLATPKPPLSETE